MDIRWLGQSCFSIGEGGSMLLIDPFLTDNPKGATSSEGVVLDPGGSHSL